ncbi:MAG: formamidopyrimidine-DNA glycosylase, partial [Chloroflexi bacterium]|nr:formamidopyrimidine-DNA glycosylase [Chloroflexota bacterium]
MPELPEVETIRQDLRPLVLGRTIDEAWVSPNAPRLVQLLPPAEFCPALAGRRIEEVTRRGKYLLFHLNGGLTWAVHLRMTGSLQHLTSGCPQGPHVRATFRLDDGAWLCYVDTRKLGTMWLTDDASLVVGKLGPEPLADDFGPQELRRLLQRRAAPVKAVLLDQEAIAGIGNFYADEALFVAR